MSGDFMECAACAAKPGAPTLCASCLNNRALIGALVRIETFLHERRMHPDYEYALTVQTIAHAERPPDGEGWVRNGTGLSAVTDEVYVPWRRPRN